jgi:hypothetical protein
MNLRNIFRLFSRISKVCIGDKSELDTAKIITISLAIHILPGWVAQARLIYIPSENRDTYDTMMANGSYDMMCLAVGSSCMPFGSSLLSRE